MVKRILKLWHAHSLFWTSFFLLGIYLVLTAPALGSTHHILYNLEPYPDGLLYALSARNLTLGAGLGLAHQNTFLPMWVPPLYAVFLSTGYFLWQEPQTFYVMNVLLGMMTLYLLIRLGTKLTGATKGGIVTGLIYLSHVYILWLPTVPMSENLALFCFTLILYGLLRKNFLKYKFTSIVGIVGLFFSRYATIGVVLTSIVLLVAETFPRVSKKKAIFYVGLAILTFVVAFLVLVLRGTPIISMGINFCQDLVQGSTFYSFGFMKQNIWHYIQILVGQNSQFLWLTFPLTSFLVSFGSLSFLLVMLKKGTHLQKWYALILLMLFLSQLPLLLIFYIVDARYIILSIPLFAITLAWLFTTLQRKLATPVVLVLFGIVFLGQLFSQRLLFRQLIANNLLHHSQAWQYEAIKEFNRFFQTHSESYLITALPPYLVDAYRNQSYRILPLSLQQEFLDKQEFVWGNDLVYDHLLANYRDFLKSGKMVYITNAYLSAETGFGADFAVYQEKFQFELVHSGCLNTCNIYRLHLK